MKPDRDPLASHQIHLVTVCGLCVSERVDRGVGRHPEPGRLRISNYFCLDTYKTSDCIVETLEAWWAALDETEQVAMTRRHINMDNGPESSGRRAPLLQRMVALGDASGKTISLLY